MWLPQLLPFFGVEALNSFEKISKKLFNFSKSTAMRKLLLFSAVLSLFLLVPASITRAQSISLQKGLTTAVFPTQYGNIKIYLPDDMQPGDMISGTVLCEPAGNNARQQQKNLAELITYSLSIDGNTYPVKADPENFAWLVHQDRRADCPIELINVNGIKTNELKYIFKQPPVNAASTYSECAVPSHALTDAPCRITGNFDGNAANTNCTLDNQPMQVLAESPRQCIVQYPANGQGPGNMQINENGEQKCNRQISGVDMQVTTGDLNLRKGQSTFIDVKLTGLQNLPDKAILTITNVTPNVVTMTNGNVQVIPVWPPADSANGTFFVHCPAVSITTGTFVVEINLDLPQPGDITTTASECPPGYTKKSCECGALVKATRSGNTISAVATPACKGVYGIGINTFPVCSILKTEYNWTIKDGKENVELTGKTNGPSVTIKPKNNRGFVVCVSVTVTCIDGTVCTATDCVTQSGETVPPPTSSKCGCSAKCEVITGKKTGNSAEFSGKITAACTGTSGSGETRIICAVGKITYNWSIGAGGKDVAEIDGKNDGPSVKVKIKKEGPYNIYLTGTVTCSDGTTCDFSCNAEIPYIPGTNEKICLPDVSEKMEPKMAGGLKSKQAGTGSTSTIFRDDFIALEATGSDVDLVTFNCNPQVPCPDTRSEKTIAVTGKVRFAWAITAGEGKFVKLGCGAEDEKTDKGEHVIFQPPYVALPVKSADTSVLTTIILSIIDDGSPVTDPTVTKTITIRTTRKKSIPDRYEVTITGGEPDKAAAPALPVVDGSCKLVGPTWKPGDNLAEPVIILPGVTDADKMVLGQWIALKSQDQQDPDDITFNCTSTNCTSAGGGKSYPDKIIWEWTIVSGGGKFILGSTGQYVVYEAPLEMPKGKEVIEVKIKLKVMNPAGERKDPDKSSKEFILKIYQPGVRLSHPELTWLPEADNSLELKSELMYKESGKWLPALSHMCRILYFELMNVSTEKGVCLNFPVPKDADDCRDLHLKKEGDQEAWDDAKASGTKCDTKELYQQARTKRPGKEYTISVYSRDFGSYGFLRSFANVNKKTSIEGNPVYISIPIKRTDVAHPKGRPKKTEYADNRVTIPYDIDENRIADGGWEATGGVAVADPAENNKDEDDKPTGDAFKGDGFTTYEEYRGFKTTTKKGDMHQRTNYEVKDIFIRNESGLPITLYDDISELDAHEITEAQYISDDKRQVNFNFNKTTHLNYIQAGLHLVDKGTHSSLLGIAFSTTGQPTVPNAEIEIRVYTTRIKASVDKVNKGVAAKDKLSYGDKLAAVVAHELLHGNNVCHHGEGNPEVENSFDLINGLRSGNVDCVMRYDNVGTPLSAIPEKPGTDMCTSAAGTGYNAGGQRFRDAADKRGNCKGQIRVSGAGGIPKSCGNR
jgi:hypothetical protein